MLGKMAREFLEKRIYARAARANFSFLSAQDRVCSCADKK